MDLESIIRPRRKALVLAAESAVRESRGALPFKSQLNQLAAICGEAMCAEEICNYLRYQASRKGAPWPREFAELVIAKMEAPLAELSQVTRSYKDIEQDRARVAAWRLYAVFLVRAHAYTTAAGQKGQR